MFRPRCPPYVNNTPRPHSATDGRHLRGRRNRTRNARTHPNLGASRISSGIAAASGGGTDRVGPARTYARTYAAPGGPAPLPAHAAIHAVRCTINVVRVPGGFLRFGILAALSHSGPRLFLRYVCGAVPFSIAVAPHD